jgi:hypothetical protein
MAVHVDEQIALRPDDLAYGGGAIQPQFSEFLQFDRISEVRGHAVERRKLDGVESSGDGLLWHGRETSWRALLGGTVDIRVVADSVAQRSAQEFIRGDALP